MFGVEIKLPITAQFLLESLGLDACHLSGASGAQWQQRIGGNEARFEVGQWSDAEVGLGGINILLNGERDEES